MDKMFNALNRIHLEAGKPELSEHERLIARAAYSFGMRDGIAKSFEGMKELHKERI